MYKLKKDGIVRIVTTEAEAERWNSLGYEFVTAPDESGSGEVDPLLAFDVDALKAFAVANNINIGNSTSKGGIYKKIREALPWAPAQAEE